MVLEVLTIEKKALKDLRKIVRENSVNGVYLWDPFARSNDLLNTLYFCPYSNSEMKVITSFSKRTREVFNEIRILRIGKKTN